MKVTITQIARNNKTSKAGKPYVSLGIKCNEYGDKFINGFGNKGNEHWKVGDTVEVEIEQKGEYLNFSMPTHTKTAEASNEQMALINRKLDAIWTKLGVIEGALNTRLSDGSEPPIL